MALGAAVAIVTTVPFMATAMSYRHRDNGLAYLLLVLGVGVWNGMLLAQLINPDPRIKAFFLALTVVGSLLAGLGWFLFASTASRTSDLLSSPASYGTVAVLAGLDIVFAVTTPAHSIYWTLPPGTGLSTGFAVVVPQIGYWLHIVLLVGLFAAGTWLFAGAWRARLAVRYTRAYTLTGGVLVVAIVGSAVITPGGLSVAPPVAMALSTIGWVQARRGRVFGAVRRWIGTRT